MEDTPHTDPEWLDAWDDEEPEEQLPGPRRWRRRALVIVAVITALAVAIIPLYNLFGRTPPVSDTGLEICRFDYCIVQERMIDAGLLPVMNRLSNTFIDEQQAVAMADDIARHLRVDSVNLRVVDQLEGRLGGVYHPDSRTVLIRRPARAWIVAHEMAHVVATGHGDEFTETLIAIARWLDSGP